MITCACLPIPNSQFFGKCHHAASAGSQLQIGWITSRIAPVVTGKNQHKVGRRTVVRVDQNEFRHRVDQGQGVLDVREADHVLGVMRRATTPHSSLLGARGLEPCSAQRGNHPSGRNELIVLAGAIQVGRLRESRGRRLSDRLRQSARRDTVSIGLRSNMVSSLLS